MFQAWSPSKMRTNYYSTVKWSNRHVSNANERAFKIIINQIWSSFESIIAPHVTILKPKIRIYNNSCFYSKALNPSGQIVCLSAQEHLEQFVFIAAEVHLLLLLHCRRLDYENYTTPSTPFYSLVPHFSPPSAARTPLVISPAIWQLSDDGMVSLTWVGPGSCFSVWVLAQ